jgi:ceramide glucosyltransferase
MLLDASRIALVIAAGAASASIVYLLWALSAVRAFGRIAPAGGAFQPPVTVLKPVCGLDPGLYGNLRSFCEQDYPEFQVIFGVRDADDPAIPVIERVIRDFPDRDLSLVLDERVIGTNLKVSNLANMYDEVKHDILVVADSDMRVDRGYLAAVTAPFADEAVGAVTCLYRGSPVGGLPSVLGSMFINDWFLPSVLSAARFHPMRFCFGATMAVRRPALEEIGGFPALASHIADDYMLGRLVTDAGYRIVLSPYVVENLVLEPDFATLMRHEIRWGRTVRSVQPLGYSFSFLTNSIPLALFLTVASGFAGYGWAALASALILRIVLHYQVRATFGVRGLAAPWLVPVRDFVGLVVWGGSFFGRDVHWREQRFLLEADGQLAMKG